MKKTTPTSYRTFGWVTLCTFAGVYFVLFITSDNLFVPILPGLVLAICPYIYLIARRHMLSIRNSYDIGPVVKALIPKYRASHRNMRHALPLLTKTETQTPFVRALARLHLKLNRAHSSEHAQEIIRNFNAQTGTDWSKRLSSLIYKAYIENIDVEDALVKLEEDITATQAAMKDGRTERMDTFLLGILPVFALPGGLALLYIAVTRNAFHYQFGTPQGIKSFVMSLVVSLAAALVGIIFNRPKQDI
ncbi:hypothetical protein [Alicyclobacillus fodiniaquatilis]|uniref:Type II secretion system protein GspF domain-containing protein n=1 Tax=Alicyclobacillus fodiniaquatilis TaxID=1661150 RepID=A0ABW4JFE9_9BACL